MSDTVIRVENLGKKYIIGHQQEGNSRYVALRDVISNGVRSFGKRLRHPGSVIREPNTEEFWALKDVSFEVKRGEVVGIIGRNGAGKSTLLKILSRITEPTTGRVSLKGRVASLLEVGTGFHPELTGRENIFLNGAILGMGRHEINRKFDEIVEFAEVSKFLDTPVKRYSSGMYVRLAFAVAAHLEPEILIVDEVLAVGDSVFQKKCLGKIGDVAQREGRTVFFVSHNMAAVRTLCDRTILLSKGLLGSDSNTEEGIRKYLSEATSSDSIIYWNGKGKYKTQELSFTKAYILNHKKEVTSILDHRNEFSVVIEYEVLRPIKGLRIGFGLQTSEGLLLCGSNDPDGWEKYTREPSSYISRCIFPGHILNKGTYLINFSSDKYPYGKALVSTSFCLSIIIEDVQGHGDTRTPLPGAIRPKLEWIVDDKNN
jgi:lipopolysaccharide transport system ATP-binding protein